MKLKTLLAVVLVTMSLGMTAQTAAPKAAKASAAKTEKVADGGLTIIDFNATWCGPCKRFAPIFEAAAEKFKGKATFKSVDVDENQALAVQYNVQSIPTVVFIRDGKEVDRVVGLQGADEFNARILKNLKPAKK